MTGINGGQTYSFTLLSMARTDDEEMTGHDQQCIEIFQSKAAQTRDMTGGADHCQQAFWPCQLSYVADGTSGRVDTRAGSQ